MANLRQIGGSVSQQFRGLKGRHPGQWPLFPRLLCALGTLLGVVLLGWVAYLNGQQQELDDGRKREQELREAYRSKVKQAINLKSLQQQKEQVNEYVSTLEKQLPSKAEMDALLSDINQAGLGRGLQFELFKPAAQETRRDFYAELPISIKVTGSYHDIGAFASDIGKLSRIVTLENIALASAGKGGGLALDALAKTFRYLDDEELAQQRRAAAAKKGGKR